MLQPFLIHCKQDPKSDLLLLGHLGHSWITFTACHPPQHRDREITIVQIAKRSATAAHFIEVYFVISL